MAQRRDREEEQLQKRGGKILQDNKGKAKREKKWEGEK